MTSVLRSVFCLQATKLSRKDIKILSPYTVTSKDRKRIYILIAVVVIMIIAAICVYIIVRNNSDNDDFIESEVSYKIGE